jgi:hypothetical protein
MDVNMQKVGSIQEKFIGELTDAALEVASRHGVHGPSVDQELSLWWSLNEVFRKPKSVCDAEATRAESRREDFLARLTDAAYQEALRRGFNDSFLDVRLDLWKALRRVFWEGQFAAPFFRVACPTPEPSGLHRHYTHAAIA